MTLRPAFALLAILLPVTGTAPATAQPVNPAERLIEGLRAAVAGEATVSYGALDGDAGETTITDLAIRDTEAAGGVVTIGRLQLRDIGAAAAGGLPPIGEIVATDLRLTGPASDPGELTVGRIELAGADLPGLVALAQAGPDADPVPVLTADRAAIEDLRFDSQGEPPDFTLGSVVLEDLAAGRVGTFRLYDLSMVKTAGPDPGKVRLGSIEIDGFDAAPFIAVALKGGDVVDALTQLELGRFQVLGLTVDVPSSVRGRVDEVLLADVERRDGRVVGHRFALAVDMPVAELDDPATREALAGMGFESLPISLSYTQDLDPETNILSIAPLMLEIAGAGTVTLDLESAGFPTADYLAGGDLDPLRFLGMTLKGARLVYDDASLIERALAYGAGLQGVTPAALVDQMAANLAGAAAGAGKGAAGVAAALEAMLRNPGELVVTAAPATPVPLLGLGIAAAGNPLALVDALNLTVEAR